MGFDLVDLPALKLRLDNILIIHVVFLLAGKIILSVVLP